MKRLLCRVAVLVLLFGSALAEAQEAQYSEAEVKAAFLYHFGTYVQWPPSTRDSGPITIAVLGADAVVDELRAFLPGRKIQGRAVEVRPLGRIEDLGDDEVLFIGGDRNGNLRVLIEAVGKRPVLLVTDAPDGLDRGAMVNFQIVDGRVRFETSVPRAEEAGLMLSSRLLSAALRVETSRSSPDVALPFLPAFVFSGRSR
ncbi:MAG TPA: YfiR family protein [Gammaproteobacteria bacterium]|nr:YfiR family protein [Gammaproteobacteria bacterium]